MSSPPTRFSDFLFLFADTHPQRELAVLNDLRISYADAAELVAALSRALLATGVRRGDRVAVLCTPRPEALLIHLAAIDIGATTLGLTPKYQPEELRYLLADSRPHALFVLPRFEGRELARDAAPLAAELGIETVVQITGLGEGRPGFTSGFDHARPATATGRDGDAPASSLADLLDLGRLLDDEPRQLARAAVRAEDPALLVYTSGTTGKPKGAQIAHRGLGWTYLLQARRWNVDGVRMLCNGPLNHLSGLGELCGTALVSAGTCVFMERFDAAAQLRLMAEERISGLIGIPTTYQLLAADPDFATADLSALRRLTWAGAAMPAAVLDAWRQRTDAVLEVQYGSTETTLTVTYSDRDADLEQLRESIGRPDPEIELRIADDSGRPVADGEPGEIQVRHPGVFIGYLGNPGATATVFTADGFLRTGDVGARRADGTLRLVGRRSDMYKSGGANVYPREIELCLERHPSVAIAAVVSVPDPLYSEVGHAFVVPRAGSSLSADQLRQWCTKRLANYKRPKQIIVTDRLPVLENTKIDRRALRDRARASLAAAAEPAAEIA